MSRRPHPLQNPCHCEGAQRPWQSASPSLKAPLPKGGCHGKAVTGGFFFRPRQGTRALPYKVLRYRARADRVVRPYKHFRRGRCLHRPAPCTPCSPSPTHRREPTPPLTKPLSLRGRAAPVAIRIPVQLKNKHLTNPKNNPKMSVSFSSSRKRQRWGKGGDSPTRRESAAGASRWGSLAVLASELPARASVGVGQDGSSRYRGRSLQEELLRAAERSAAESGWYSVFSRP